MSELKFQVVSFLVFSILFSCIKFSEGKDLIFELNQTYSLKEVPEKITSCKVKLSSGKLIDLTSLDRASSPR